MKKTLVKQVAKKVPRSIIDKVHDVIPQIEDISYDKKNMLKISFFLDYDKVFNIKNSIDQIEDESEDDQVLCDIQHNKFYASETPETLRVGLQLKAEINNVIKQMKKIDPLFTKDELLKNYAHNDGENNYGLYARKVTDDQDRDFFFDLRFYDLLPLEEDQEINDEDFEVVGSYTDYNFFTKFILTIDENIIDDVMDKLAYSFRNLK